MHSEQYPPVVKKLMPQQTYPQEILNPIVPGLLKYLYNTCSESRPKLRENYFVRNAHDMVTGIWSAALLKIAAPHCELVCICVLSLYTVDPQKVIFFRKYRKTWMYGRNFLALGTLSQGLKRLLVREDAHRLVWFLTPSKWKRATFKMPSLGKIYTGHENRSVRIRSAE